MSGLEPELLKWVEERCGQTVADAARIPGGASRQAWVVTLDDGSQLFLRMDAGTSALSAVGYNLAREAVVYRWLADKPVRAAGFRGVSPDGRALLLDFVEGAPGPLDDSALAREFMEQVNALHILEPPADLALDDLDVWSRLYREHCPDSDPLIDLCLRQLAETSPGPPERAVLVHGDLGPGNVLHDGQQVTGLCDWELAHVGDPMEDLAWITVRSMLTPFVDIDTAFGWYDGPVDAERVRYWQLACQVRNLIGLGVTGAAGGDLGMGMLFSTLHRRVTAELLCELLGVEAEPIKVPEPADTEASAAYEAVLDDLRTVIAPALEGYPAARAKSVARLVRYLDMVDRIGSTLADQDRADRDRFDMSVDAEAAHYWARATQRKEALMGPAMGRLAGTRLPRI
ncbi:MAG: phosphotransferase family protein [Acidimicrobiia bacterium]|nr:phosphotransferase family protein [Acidimicrobiia bacterium]MYG71080.1 phosphotransferase family protein [Acidimicrobiia bacterium]